jgi:RNA polymerase sigma-70 factor, ECF subfamily
MLRMSWNHDGAGPTNVTGIEYIDGLYGYAMALTRNHAQAEDLVQETYFRAIRAMGRVQTHSNMKGWLFTILRNIWLNELRSSRNSPQLVGIDLANGVADSVVEPSRNSHDLYVAKIEMEQVRAAIQKLSVEFREIILLREYEDLTYQEIASILKCPVGTVMSRLGRARAKLRILISPTLKRSDSLEVRDAESLVGIEPPAVGSYPNPRMPLASALSEKPVSRQLAEDTDRSKSVDELTDD